VKGIQKNFVSTDSIQFCIYRFLSTSPITPADSIKFCIYFFLFRKLGRMRGKCEMPWRRGGGRFRGFGTREHPFPRLLFTIELSRSYQICLRRGGSLLGWLLIGFTRVGGVLSISGLPKKNLVLFLSVQKKEGNPRKRTNKDYIGALPKEGRIYPGDKNNCFYVHLPWRYRKLLLTAATTLK